VVEQHVPRKHPDSVSGTWLTRVLVCDAERDTSGGVGLLQALDGALTLVPVKLGGIAAIGQISRCNRTDLAPIVLLMLNLPQYFVISLLISPNRKIVVHVVIYKPWSW